MEMIRHCTDLLTRAESSRALVPDWEGFCTSLKELYNLCKMNHGGANATYIPQLAKQDPNWWAIAVEVKKK